MSVRRPTLLALCAALVAPWVAIVPDATAQDAPERTLVPLLPAAEGQSGALNFLNPTRRHVRAAGFATGVDGQPFLDEQLLALSGTIIPPGGSLRVPYVSVFSPDEPLTQQPAGHFLMVTLGGSLELFLEVTDGTAISTIRTRKQLRATQSLVLPGFRHRADGTQKGIIGISSASTGSEASVSVEVRDAANQRVGITNVVLDPNGSVILTGDDLGLDTAGDLTVFIDSDRLVLADALVSTATGLSFITSGRDAIEFGQFWYPFGGMLPFTSGVSLANTATGGTFGAIETYFSRKGKVERQLGPTDVSAATVIQSLNGDDIGFTGMGALCIDVPTGSAPRAPVGVFDGAPGDLEFFDPMRRIEPGQHGMAPVPAHDTDLMATSALLVNNPTNLTALGFLRVLDAQGRVLSSKKLKLKPFNTVTLPFSKVLKKLVGPVAVQILMPASPGSKGGGPLQAAVVLSSESLDGKKPTGDTSKLAVTPLVAYDVEDVPVIVGAEVTKPTDDKKAALLLDGLAAAVGRKALLKMVDPDSGAELGASFKIAGGKSVLKLKLKSKSLEAKERLAQLWPLGAERTFVLVDVAADTESERVTIRRGPELP